MLDHAEMQKWMNEIRAVADAPKLLQQGTLQDRDKPASLTLEYLKQQNANQYGTQFAEQRPEVWPRAEHHRQGQIETENRDLG